MPDSPHTFVTPSKITRASQASEPPPAHQEAFEKTFALFCSITLEGCAAQLLTSDQSSDGPEDATAGSTSESVGTPDSDSESIQGDREVLPADSDTDHIDTPDQQRGGEEEVDHRHTVRPTRSKRPLGCRGQIVAKKEKTTGKTYLCCEFWGPLAQNRYHFILRSLHEHDFDYLCALIEGDQKVIQEKEKAAQELGYGPLVACNHIGEVRQVSERCLFWHRDPVGKSLAPGYMVRSKPACGSKLDTFIPHDLHRFPFVVIVTSGSHNHPPPRRTKTPIIFVDFLRSLILEEGWKIADATPRRLITDGAFVERLRNILGWTAIANPSLADLHPSLANLDHVSWLIKEIQRVHFPDGTDWEGAQRLYNAQISNMDSSKLYVRHVEERTLRGSQKPFRLIVCGFPDQFRLLARARWPAIDTSFKRVKNWMEFGMEFWDGIANRSISVCRAFVNSQSADAHEHLFRVIDAIFEQDVGHPLEFYHLHGKGIQVITVDEHKGQALGLGRYLVWKSRTITVQDSACPSKRICDLQPYEHLERVLRLCIVHFKRGIIAIEKIRAVERNVITAMYSLASTEPIQDLEGTKRLIAGGGVKAKNWLEDKVTGAPFALPALYHPLSKIPRENWIAAKSSTNGIEQTHHNLNLDGVGLTLIGGIMRGYHYDARAISLNNLTLEHAMHPKYKPATHLQRTQVSLQRRATASKKRASSVRSQENSPEKKKKAKASVAQSSTQQSPAVQMVTVEENDREETDHEEDISAATSLLGDHSSESPSLPAPASTLPGPKTTAIAPLTLNPPPSSLRPPGTLLPAPASTLPGPRTAAVAPLTSNPPPSSLRPPGTSLPTPVSTLPGPRTTAVAPLTSNPPSASLQPPGTSVFTVPPGYYIAYVPFMLPIAPTENPYQAVQGPSTSNSKP